MFIDETREDSPEIESQEAEVEEQDSETVEETPEQDQTDWEKEAKKWKAIAKRAETKQAKQVERPTESTSTLSAKDFLALKDANISADDFDEVQEFANFKKITIADAIKHPTMRSILNERQEERRTAQATATRSPRGTSKISPEDLLRKAERGELPDSNEGMTAIFLARRERQFKK